MSVEVEEDDGQVTVVVGSIDGEPIGTEEEVLTDENVLFELCEDMIEVTLLADEDAEGPVEQRRRRL